MLWMDEKFPINDLSYDRDSTVAVLFLQEIYVTLTAKNFFIVGSPLRKSGKL